MKKIFIFIALFLGSQSGFAQTEQGQSVVSLNVGYSLIGNATTELIKGLTDDSQVKVRSVPSLMLAYDFGLTDNFSIGVFGGYQSASAEFSYTYFPNLNDSVTEMVKVSGSRLNLAVRPNFHYGNGDNLDLYSGLRIGYLIRNFEQNSTDEDFGVLDIFDGSRVTFGLTLFGARYFVTDNIGLNLEVGIGVPFLFSGGVNFRF
jgi:opacity protein-like surface antigen